MSRRTFTLGAQSLALAVLSLALSPACSTASTDGGTSPGDTRAAATNTSSSTDAHSSSEVSGPQAHLVAFLPMQEGYGPSDQDQYEATIAPIADEHGMARVAAYTVGKFLGGTGPSQASTVGVWALDTPESMGALMSDERYQGNVVNRDRVHDMQHAAMYMTHEEFSGQAPAPGSAVLVGMLPMREGYGFDDHHEYEASISEITQRHGMRLYKEYRVMKTLSPGAPEIAAINIWVLDSPDVLGAVMQDPEYATHIEYRDQIHDMEAMTMYFVAPRAAQ